MFFKNIERWNIIKMSNNIIPRSSCVGKETTHVPQRFAYEFMKGVIITLSVQWSAESWEFVFKIRRRLTADNQIRYFSLPPVCT